MMKFWLVRIHCGSVTCHVTVLRSSAVTIGTSVIHKLMTVTSYL